MEMTDRVRGIIEANLTDHYIPLALNADGERIFPMYFGRIIGENTIVFPATGSTGVDEILKKPTPAVAMVADRESGFEAYLLSGSARYVTQETDYQLVAAMQNEVPGFPIRGAVAFQVESVHLTPPT